MIDNPTLISGGGGGLEPNKTTKSASVFQYILFYEDEVLVGFL
jgi:hypothetical protein